MGTDMQPGRGDYEFFATVEGYWVKPLVQGTVRLHYYRPFPGLPFYYLQVPGSAGITKAESWPFP